MNQTKVFQQVILNRSTCTIEQWVYLEVKKVQLIARGGGGWGDTPLDGK